jgi:uncharacterized protein (DUF849 family)
MFGQGRNRKVIITCAPTGSVHTPSMSPYLPVTADQIAVEAIAAAEAGASIIHLHARNEDGSPTPSPDAFMAFLPRIKQATKAAINISTGGSTTMTLDQRIEAAKSLKPEVASLNMGPLIFDFSAAAARVEKWQNPWEEAYVRGSTHRIMYNDMGYIERIMREVGIAGGTRFEFECYDISHLYTLAHFADLKLIEPPFMIQGVFGILGGLGPDPRNLVHMTTIADGLFGKDYHFSAFGAGRHQISFCTQSVLLGGHCRVGLEDSLSIGRGQLATSNAEQVRKMVTIIHELGLEIATPDEARQLLGLKGGDQVLF